MLKRYLILSLLILGVNSCYNPPPEFPEGPTEAYKPIYATNEDMSIGLETSRDIVNPGQIYIKGELLLINEIGEGIHIIDNTDPSDPINRGFLKILGAENMALKDGVLYINQFNSIIVVDVNDIQNFRILSTHEAILDNSLYEVPVPPVQGYYFECVDPEKGQVIGWQLTTVNNPKCFR